MNPVQRGHVVQFFLNGLGAVVAGTQPASGELTPGTLPLASTQTWLVGDDRRPSSDCAIQRRRSLAVGLYQVNAIMPAELSPGFQAVVISTGEVSSKATLLAVQ